MIRNLFFIMMLLIATCADAEVAGKKIIDYKAIKQILKNDKLDVEIDKKREEAKRKKNVARRKEKNKYQIPNENEFWTFFSEYWLVKNAQVLKWDFEKPDYGLRESVESLLEKMGFYEKRFKLLLINTSTVSHFALPGGKEEYIFIVSLPFVRTLDLSKLEIALLIFEDLVRVDQGYFKSFLKNSKMTKLIGKNFYKKKLKEQDINGLMAMYDKKIFEVGYSFKEQFEVTKKMDKYLKSDLNLWYIFLNMKKKINNLVKSNVLYSSYAKIYPSPELQINWLTPKNKEE